MLSTLSPLVGRLIDIAIEEDLLTGDCTSESCIDGRALANGVIYAKSELIMCGELVIPEIISRADFGISLETIAKDGSKVEPGGTLATFSGSARGLLACERLLLNFLQHLCSVASYSREASKKCSNVTILDTRKTTPGWRVLDKYAVRVGGAKNHRGSLGDMILVKNNHVDLHGGDIRKCVLEVLQKKSPYLPVEVEVRSLVELRSIIDLRLSVVMLDNMSISEMTEAVQLIKESNPSLMIEASGGLATSQLEELSKIGVEFVSLGALTQSPPRKDISMKITPSGA